jgi:hypothetical protein
MRSGTHLHLLRRHLYLSQRHRLSNGRTSLDFRVILVLSSLTRICHTPCSFNKVLALFLNYPGLSRRR